MTQLIWIDLNRWHLILPRYSINNLAIQFACVGIPKNLLVMAAAGELRCGDRGMSGKAAFSSAKACYGSKAPSNTQVGFQFPSNTILEKQIFFVNQPELTPDTSSAPNRLVNITWMNLFLGGSPHNHCRADCAPWAQFAASVALVAIGLQEKTTKVEKWRWTKAAKTCIWMVDKDFDGEVSIRLATGTYEHPKMSRFHLFCFNISHFWTLKELKKPG